MLRSWRQDLEVKTEHLFASNCSFITGTESELRELQNKRFELQRMLLPREILYEEYIARDKLHECAVYFLLESDKVSQRLPRLVIHSVLG